MAAMRFLAHMPSFLFPRRTNPHHQAAHYLDTALSYMQRHSVRRERIDWRWLRAEARKRIAHASCPAETYETIEWTLQQLGDHHSLFLTPEQRRQLAQGKWSGMGLLLSPEGVVIEVLPASPASQASISVGDRIMSLDGEPVNQENLHKVHSSSSLVVELQPRGQHESRTLSLEAASFQAYRLPTARVYCDSIGLLELPSLLGQQDTHYALTAQRAIQRLDQQYSLTGWIIDLRRNGGGNMWPMLAGVGPILGEGEVGAFQSAGRRRVPWFYHQGEARLGRWVVARVASPYQLKHPMPAVALLMSEQTTSSGEAMVVAFRGRPCTRSFGAPTAGLPTANQGFELPDKAMLQLTTALDADRTGASYESSLEPDQRVPLDWSQGDTEQDPIVQAALEWLQMDS